MHLSFQFFRFHIYIYIYIYIRVWVWVKFNRFRWRVFLFLLRWAYHSKINQCALPATLWKEKCWMHDFLKRYESFVKCKQYRPGFELETQSPFSTTIIFKPQCFSLSFSLSLSHSLSLSLSLSHSLCLSVSLSVLTCNCKQKLYLC